MMATGDMAKLITIACVLLVAGLLVADKNKHAAAKAVTKISASLAFIAVAVHNGALDWGHHTQLIAVGLMLGAVGDAALLSNDKKPFLLGIVMFLLSHVAYIAAFVVLGLSWRGAGASLVVLIPVAVAVRRWVGNAGSLGGAVTAYVVVITTMVACSVGALVATVNPHRAVLLVAALLFFVSDICVARERFVTPGFVNRLVGLPLYYAAQLLFAWSVTVVGLARG